jgi:acyl-CoA thioesterase-2
MSTALENLVAILDVEKIEANTFRGNSQDLGFRQLFGGHVLAQALMAAYKTVEPGRWCHSLHGYFLRLGKTDQPIFYEVDLLRSGHSFTTRQVVAKQGGVAIFNLAASFQRPEPGNEHQVPMPQVAGPDGITSELERIRAIQDQIPVNFRENLTAERAIEVRVVDPADFFQPKPKAPIKNTWFRAAGPLKHQSLAVHQAILAYASDFGLASTAGLPHGFSFFKPGIQIASLDHSIWFHRPITMDGWMLYAKDSPSSAGARGFNRGQIFTQDGVLVASVAQESLIRNGAQKHTAAASSGSQAGPAPRT